MSTELLEKTKPQPVADPAKAAPRLVPAAAKRPPAPPRPGDDEEDDEPGFFRRYRVLLGVAVLVIAGSVYVFSGPSTPSAPGPVRKAAVPINVTLPPLPPPPLPPPPPPKVEPPKEEMEEQAPVDEAPPEPAPDDSPPPPGTNNVGDGKGDNFGLGKATGGNGTGTGRRVGGTASKYGYYAAQVQNSISAAVRRHGRTKSATMSITARIWVDETGRVTRATLSGSSGDQAVDTALKNDVLTGLQLQSPPPAGMKMPINLRLTARSPR